MSWCNVHEVKGEVQCGNSGLVLQDCKNTATSGKWFPDQSGSATSAEPQAATLRAAAIVLEITVCVFNLDADPPRCDIYVDLRPPVKVCKASGTQVHCIEGPAWSIILGQHKLPRQLIGVGQQGRESVAILVQLKGGFFSCSPLPPISSQPAAETAEATFAALGITFQDVAYKHINKRPKGEAC